MGKKKVGRIVTAVLRHSPAFLGLTCDKQGYVEVDKLIEALNDKGYQADKELIETIGANERFSFDENHIRMRADYGHSIGLRLEDMYTPSEPPEYLYHGTHTEALESIKKIGIIRFPQMEKARDHIFLTDDIAVALKKGGRHGNSVALPILAKKMHQNGYQLYHVKNDIWLTEATIPPAFIDFNQSIYETDETGE